MDTGNVHGFMIPAAFSDFSQGISLRTTEEAPPVADLIWGQSLRPWQVEVPRARTRTHRGASPRREQCDMAVGTAPARTPQYSKRPKEGKNSIRRKAKEGLRRTPGTTELGGS